MAAGGGCGGGDLSGRRPQERRRAERRTGEARRIWPEYHNVAEIGRALRKREDRLRDPESPGWQQLYREIITRYSWGLPEDLRKAIRQGATQAY